MNDGNGAVPLIVVVLLVCGVSVVAGPRSGAVVAALAAAAYIAGRTQREAAR